MGLDPELLSQSIGEFQEDSMRIVLMPLRQDGMQVTTSAQDGIYGEQFASLHAAPVLAHSNGGRQPPNIG